MRRGARPGRPAGALLTFCTCLALAAPGAAAAEPPSLGTVWVSAPAPESATANSYLNPNGLTASWHFEYVSQAAYEANVAAGRADFAGAALAPPSGAGAPVSTPQAVSAPLTGLAPSTLYHLRLLAANSAGAAASLTPALFTTTTTLIACEGDSCQPLPSPPDDPAPGTLVPTLGNPPVSFPPRRCRGGKRRVVRRGKVRCVPRRTRRSRRHHRRHGHAGHRRGGPRG